MVEILLWLPNIRVRYVLSAEPTPAGLSFDIPKQHLFNQSTKKIGLLNAWM